LISLITNKLWSFFPTLGHLYVQGDFEVSADILTCDRTPQKVTIEAIMPYTNVDIFREKGAKTFFKKCLEPLNFMKKWVKKIICM
jgi:hypothetical protein